VIVLKTILKFTLKWLRHVSVQSHHLQGAHYPCLLKLHFVKIVNYDSSVYGYISGDVAAYTGSFLVDVCMSHCSVVDCKNTAQTFTNFYSVHFVSSNSHTPTYAYNRKSYINLYTCLHVSPKHVDIN
jgi:hypothetical protein